MISPTSFNSWLIIIWYDEERAGDGVVVGCCETLFLSGDIPSSENIADDEEAVRSVSHKTLFLSGDIVLPSSESISSY